MNRRTEPHGEAGHVNVFVRDQESAITAYGKHYRVCAFLPDGNGLYCRVDHKHGARSPTPNEVLNVASKDQGVRGRWVLRDCVEYGPADNRSTDFNFAPAKGSAEP